MHNKTRIERDSFGDIAVSEDVLWGAQTQRSLLHFSISNERFPPAFILALARIKAISAEVNSQLGLLNPNIANAISQAAREILMGLHLDAFPLSVWQTGSGTQTNMNMNEVLANRASELMQGERGIKCLVHPNDHVNLGQSSNDVFPTAMHLAAVEGIQQNLLPACHELIAAINSKSIEFKKIVKIGRTHLQDAIPLTLGQEISGWSAQLVHAENGIKQSLHSLYPLAIGGTAVGTGLNTHQDFGRKVAACMQEETSFPFFCSDNYFSALASHDGLVSAHGALKTLAVALIKIANDIRWLASGPRCGLGELVLPENEPGSSIMPGKVNPTQCEAMIMACYQIIGNDVAITMGGASGSFELNVCKPLIIHNFLQSIRLLSDCMKSFNVYCVEQLQANEKKIAEFVENSLMLVTALSPHIGYEKAAEIAKYAHMHQTSLRQAALFLGYVSETQFDEWVNAKNMV